MEIRNTSEKLSDFLFRHTMQQRRYRIWSESKSHKETSIKTPHVKAHTMKERQDENRGKSPPSVLGSIKIFTKMIIKYSSFIKTLDRMAASLAERQR